MSPSLVRGALPPAELPPDRSDGTYKFICIRHTAYPDTVPDLLQFSAVDGDDFDGFDFDVARASCSTATTVGWDEGALAVQTGASTPPRLSAALPLSLAENFEPNVRLNFTNDITLTVFPRGGREV